MCVRTRREDVLEARVGGERPHRVRVHGKRVHAPLLPQVPHLDSRVAAPRNTARPVFAHNHAPNVVRVSFQSPNLPTPRPPRHSTSLHPSRLARPRLPAGGSQLRSPSARMHSSSLSACPFVLPSDASYAAHLGLNPRILSLALLLRPRGCLPIPACPSPPHASQVPSSPAPATPPAHPNC